MRHEAAIALLTRGELDPYEALIAVCWPRSERLADKDVPLRKQVYSEELKTEIRRRHAAGETLPDLAVKTGLPYPTVKMFCSPSVEKRKAKRQAKRAEEVCGELTLF